MHAEARWIVFSNGYSTHGPRLSPPCHQLLVDFAYSSMVETGLAHGPSWGRSTSVSLFGERSQNWLRATYCCHWIGSDRPGVPVLFGLLGTHRIRVSGVSESIFRPLPPNPSFAILFRELLPLVTFQSTGCMFASSGARIPGANGLRGRCVRFAFAADCPI